MASKGLDALVTPYNTTEFQAMVEAARAHHHALHDQWATIAVELRRGLGKAKGAPGLLGLDVRLAARRVTRPLMAAAGMELEIARAGGRSYQLFQELFLGRPAKKNGRTFDLTK